MVKFYNRFAFYVCSFAACFIMAFTSGCASGGFKLTREYAGWLNSQNIIVRIILYILGSFVFAVTLLIDVVIFNTMDFWDGRISAGTYEFHDAGKIYVVKHDYFGPKKLRRSTIEVREEMKANQLFLLSETNAGEIELYQNGVLRERVKNIRSVPTLASFGSDGKLIKEEKLNLPGNVAVR